MKIGYCTQGDPFDKKSWSGVNYYIFKTLEKHCGEVIPLGPVTPKLIVLAGKVLNRLSNITFGKKFNYFHSVLYAKEAARILKPKIEKSKYDLLFFAGGSMLLAYLNLRKIPIIYFTDATFNSLVDYYFDFTDLLSISKKWGNELEKKSIDKADIIICASKWAAESVFRDYKCNRDKIYSFPCGANLENLPSEQEMISVRKKPSSILRLLFIGVDWMRKGGNIAFQTMVELNNRGVDTELIVCGCKPPRDITHEKLTVIKFLDKNYLIQYHEYQELFMNSTMLFLPTRKECFGLVFCEASAFGLPVIATNTGGVSDYVKNGVNGFILPVEADFLDYADTIQNIWNDRNRYMTLCESSRHIFENELNWDVWGKKVKNIIEEKIRRI